MEHQARNLPGNIRSPAVQPDNGRTLGPSDYLDVSPADGSRSGEWLHRLVDGFLRRHPGGRMTRRIGAIIHVRRLGGGQEAPLRARPMAGKEATHPLDIHQVDADADDAHANGSRVHQNSANGRSQPGTLRNPPSTRPSQVAAASTRAVISQSGHRGRVQ